MSRRQRGAALLLTLFLVAVVGVLLAVAGRVWQTESRRAREAELLAVGAEFARALGRYRDATPNGTPEFPQRLEQLLDDRRQPVTTRHLRRLYRDPLTGSSEWGLVKDAAGRIAGVYSLAPGTPIRQDGFPPDHAAFAGAAGYADWRFVAVNAGPAVAAAVPAGPVAAPAP